MLTLRGAPALSDFRLQKLQERLRTATGPDLRIYAEFMHFADSDRDPTGEELAVLERLLRYGPRLPAHAPEGRLVLVVPRPGTISPWSSKATDIAHNCGLGTIRRLERGTAYYLETEAGSGRGGPRQGRGVPARPHDPGRVVRPDPGGAPLRSRRAPPRDPGGRPGWRARGPGRGERRPRPGPVRRRDRLPDRELHRPGAQPHGRGADDVRPGQLGALPAQDLQCRLGHRRRAPGPLPLRHDPQYHPVRTRWGPVGLQGQCRRHRGLAGTAAGPGPGDGVYRELVEAHPPADEGGDPQPPHGHRAGSRGGHRLGRARSATRGPRGAAPSPRPACAASRCRICAFRAPQEPWEQDHGRPGRIVSALDIMLEGPIGAAAFNNEFGRPNLCGYFRTFEQEVPGPARPG